MTDMNKIMDPQKTAATLKEFEKQNMKMEMTEEMSKGDLMSEYFVQEEDMITHACWSC